MKPFPLSRPVSSLLIIAVTSLPRDAEGKCRAREDMEKRAAEVYYRWGICLLALYAPGLPSAGAARNQSPHLYVQK